MLFLLFGLPVCLLPLAAYLLALATLNHRRPPTLILGAWDFAYTLLGLAGFFVVAGPVLLTGFQDDWRRFWMHRDAAPVGWWAIGLVYFLGLVGILAFFLRRRRRVTVVYNVAPAVAREALANVLGRLGRHWTEGPGHFLIRTPAEGAKPPDEPILVELDTVASFRHATLTWHRATHFERAEIETALRDELARLDAVTAPEGGSGGLVNWLLTAAVAFAILSVFSLGLLIFLVYGALRR